MYNSTKTLRGKQLRQMNCSSAFLTQINLYLAYNGQLNGPELLPIQCNGEHWN